MVMLHILKPLKTKQNTTPAYTDDAVIYKELVKELEEARALIAGATSTTEGVTTDIVFVEIWLNGLN
jgi:hypothetical protein